MANGAVKMSRPTTERASCREGACRYIKCKKGFSDSCSLFTLRSSQWSNPPARYYSETFNLDVSHSLLWLGFGGDPDTPLVLALQPASTMFPLFNP